ncbi:MULTISPECIES: hypothetical protein [Asticcacaulis]|uniref:hypothetical protein n=1 Tax=Asticcacaulis TaxID=76890 RepID=UPI001AE9D935|nr:MULTISPECIES: hypothetical protein [Asticcacaulis]MBP2158738.1 pimeloyl-ACP methyl ester carboxylesterase [Asticcacaulis solisilvae]MDR6799784.1 pimeloyl-ACP methyl ester carboxylesterase [Asticcacaulis sp. BE141]
MPYTTRTLATGGDAFDIDVYEVRAPARTIMFAAGRGGSPARHRGLLDRLAGAGLFVVAPHFDMITSPMAGADDLRQRLKRLEKAIAAFAPDGVPIVGAGHSIGGSLLLVMAGATAWTFSRESVSATTRTDFRRLILFAPPTQFFRGPGALDGVNVPVTVWSGGRDDITPPEQATFLKDAIGAEVRLAEDAGHFTFMDDLPPQVSDPHPDRPAFLAALVDEVRRLATEV